MDLITSLSLSPGGKAVIGEYKTRELAPAEPAQFSGWVWGASSLAKRYTPPWGKDTMDIKCQDQEKIRRNLASSCGSLFFCTFF